MNTLQAFILGLIQGLTEYLPVSSSGHLAIGATLFGIEGAENLAFTIAVHVATVCSTLVILRREIWALLSGCFRADREALRYVGCILVSMIPVGIVGLFFKDAVEQVFGSGLLVVGLMLLLTAVLLYFSQVYTPRAKSSISALDAFVIGVAQACAVLPGLSRSGSTIATGLLLGCPKSRLAQFSFLMVIPPILGEALLDGLKMMRLGTTEVMGDIPLSALAVGTLTAFVVGCAACRWMIGLVRRGRLSVFAVYCAVAGLLSIGLHFYRFA